MTPDRGPLTVVLPMPTWDFAHYRNRLTPAAFDVFWTTLRLLGMSNEDGIRSGDNADMAMLAALEADGWQIVVTRQRR